MDYLLRDSHHAGVHYGRYDLHRLISTVTAIPGFRGGGPRIGIQAGGWHAAEALVVARYFMFTQVYFHKTRVAYDIHIREAMKELLPGGHFPKPDAGGLDEYLKWDDWQVLGRLASGAGGEHGERLCKRDHYRRAYQTKEVQTADEKVRLDRVRDALGGLLVAEMPAGKSKKWYKTDDADIPVYESGRKDALPLSEYSSVVRNLGINDQVLLYCRPEDKAEAAKKVKEVIDGMV